MEAQKGGAQKGGAQKVKGGEPFRLNYLVSKTALLARVRLLLFGVVVLLSATGRGQPRVANPAWRFFCRFAYTGPTLSGRVTM